MTGARDGRWSAWLGLNASTTALLGTILLVTAATELWSPLIPEYLKALREGAGAGHVRMCYATSYEKLEEALRRIGRFVARVRAEATTTA